MALLLCQNLDSSRDSEGKTLLEASFKFHAGCCLALHSWSHAVVQLFCLLGWVFVLSLLFSDKVSLYSSGCRGTHRVDQGVLELRSVSAFAS